MRDAFHGKVVLVTGGTSGIGRETAVAFAARGAKVVLAGRREVEGLKVVELIEGSGGEARFIRTDISQSKQVASLVTEIVERYGTLDIAFNNAGIEGTPYVPLENYSEEAWDAVIEVNLKGLFLSMKHELPHLVKSKGAMVNMASVAGLTGGRLGAAYYASKHGVIGITKVRRRGICGSRKQSCDYARAIRHLQPGMCCRWTAASWCLDACVAQDCLTGDFFDRSLPFRCEQRGVKFRFTANRHALSVAVSL
jgi:NADP-dependent 3-hydroxy acid dehydrogenase YdfG